jgi:hypothetical protein
MGIRHRRATGHRAPHRRISSLGTASATNGITKQDLERMVNSSETFRWGHFIYDVASINRDMQSGILRGVSVSIPRTTIEWFSTKILGIEDFNSRIFPSVRLVDLCYAKTLLAACVEEPIVLAEITRFLGPESDFSAGIDVPGALQYDETSGQVREPLQLSFANIVVVDGNHRLAHAYLHAKTSMRGVLLKTAQTTKYLGD